MEAARTINAQGFVSVNGLKRGFGNRSYVQTFVSDTGMEFTRRAPFVVKASAPDLVAFGLC